jgi:hypothetical protein
VQETGVVAFEKALGRACIEHDAERGKIEATRQEYLEKMRTNTARMKHTLSLDKMPREKKVLLTEQDRDLVVREAALVEV